MILHILIKLINMIMSSLFEYNLKEQFVKYMAIPVTGHLNNYEHRIDAEDLFEVVCPWLA